MNPKLNELDANVISDIANHLNIPAYVVEKDVHVSRVINIISKIQDSAFDIMFHGGTCLAKAHQVIKRMSEDCDFRLVPYLETEVLSKGQQRRKLSNLKSLIRSQLIDQGYNIVSATSHNYSTVNDIELSYNSIFPVETVLRKEIKIELIVMPLLHPSVQKSVCSLVKENLGDKVEGLGNPPLN